MSLYQIFYYKTLNHLKMQSKLISQSLNIFIFERKCEFNKIDLPLGKIKSLSIH